MRLINIKWFLCALFSGVLVIGCAGTKLTQTWVDGAHRGNPVSNILVIGLTYKDNEKVRQFCEESYVENLKAAGIKAVSSVNAISIPANMKLEKEEILKVVNKFHNDAVIITHLVDKEAKESSTGSGAALGGFYGYYGSAYNSGRSSNFSTSYKSVVLATSLYDVKTEKLIWSGKSETLKPDSARQMFDDVIKAVIQDLQKNNLLLQK